MYIPSGTAASLLALSLSASLLTGCNSREKEAEQVLAQVKHTVVTARMLTSATKLERNLAKDSAACVTIDDLVASKRIEVKDRTDAWGTPFKIKCEEDEVTVTS